MAKTLRAYQEAAIKGLFNWLFTENTGHPLVVAPVGSGKSLIIAEFIKRVHEDFPRTRILLLTHVKELLLQNAEELHGQYPDCDFGFYCAGLGQKRLHNDVTFATIQSVNGKLAEFNRCPELILIDECHLLSHNDETTYRRFIDSIHAINPNCKIIGLTGTPFRADTRRLDTGHGKLFDGVCYEIPMKYMIEEGYWARPVTPKVDTKMSVDGVGSRGGDYIVGQLEKAINVDHITDGCVRELILHGKDRHKWLVFTAAVQHCTDVTKAIQSAGIDAAMVTGETPSDERSFIIERFRRGDLRCLVNVAVLTTGFNVPDVDLLAFMRPTRSPVLYIQTTGRGIRPVYADGFDLTTKEGRLAAIAASKKPNCMILDFGGVIDALGAIDAVDITKKNKEKEESESEKKAPSTKVCPACGEMCMSGQRYCYNCSYCFIELDDKPAANAVISQDEPPRVLDVIAWARRVNAKEGKIPSMLVTYFTSAEKVYDTVCLNHPKGSFPHDKARHWHKTFVRGCDYPIPANVQEGVDYELYQHPERITVKRDGKYLRITDYDFDKHFEAEVVRDTEEDEYDIPFI